MANKQRKIDWEARFRVALQRIAAYDSPERLRREGERAYGLDYPDSLEAAYENIQDEARAALKGYRKPKKEPQPPTGVPDGQP